MRIIHSSPFAVSSFAWQEQQDQWTLTVVCKATYSLKPGTAILEQEPDAINEQDNHWDDDPRKSVYAPSDLVPYKPSPEVLLVGNAYAPRGEPVKSLFVRLLVGQLDKSIEVFEPRHFAHDGALVEGPRWTQMSLRYERAAGAGDSWNPVGMDVAAVDGYGRRHLPNLQIPGLLDIEQGAAIAAVGYGPVASRWPVRAEKLGGLAAAFLDEHWVDVPIGMDFDGSYFQSAPQDQLVEEIRADEMIVLENLHPDIERLVTHLPGVKPRTRVEMEGQPPWELMLVADTLWIDTNRAACTVTFRGQLPLERRDQQGTIYVGVEYPGEPVSFPESVTANLPTNVTKDLQALHEMDMTVADDDMSPKSRSIGSGATPALPWDRGAKPPPPGPPPPPLPPKNPDDFGETSVFMAPVHSGRMPTWLGGAVPNESAATAPPMGNPPHAPHMTTGQPAGNLPTRGAAVPPPPVTQMLRPNEVAPTSLANASQRAAQFDVPPPPSVSATPPGRPAPPIAPPMNMPSAKPAVPSAPPPRSIAPTLAGIVAPQGLGTPPLPPPVAPSAMPGTTFGQAAVLAAAKSQMAPPAPPSPEASGNVSEKSRSRTGKPDAQMLATAAFLGAAEASNAAAIVPEEKVDKQPVERSSTPGTSPGRLLVSLLWFDKGLPPRLEENPAWKRILEPEPVEPKPDISDDDDFLPGDFMPPPKGAPPEPKKPPEDKAKDDKSRVSKVVSRAAPTMDVEHALYSAVSDDGTVEPPLCIVAGELELPFDEVETLKVLTSAAAPLATADKKLKETIDLANEALGTPLGQSPEVAANFSARVREAWLKANRMLPADYLDVHSRRVLLEQRKYQMRKLIGAQWIRGVLHGVSGDKPIPTYLPAELSEQLPLFTKFAVRLVAEVLPQQDQNEAHPVALRMHALARLITTRPRR